MKISLGGIVFMAKKGFGGGMMPGGGNMNNLLKQAQKCKKICKKLNKS